MKGKRLIAISVMCIAFMPSYVWADGGVLTEADVLKMVRDRSDLAAAVSSRIEAAKAQIKGASVFENPSISYERGQLMGGGVTETEDTAALSKTFDISGSRRLHINSAEQGLKAAKLEGEKWLLNVEQDARILFFSLLHAQKQNAALQVWNERLEKSVEEVRARSNAGDVSGYDLLRLSRELSLARADLAASQAHEVHLYKNLMALVGESNEQITDRRTLVGDLVPEALPRENDQLVDLAKDSLGKRALEARREAAALDAKAARRAWVPPISLRAGYKTAEAAGERTHGFVFGISAPLPLFDRGQGDKRAAQANSQLAAVETEIAESSLEGQVNGLAAEGQKLLVAAKDLRGDIEQTSEKLIETAEVAYRGGELSVVELIDAYNSHIEAELGALNLELFARESEIELERLIGGESK